MRGAEMRQEELLFTMAGGLDQYIPPAHPLRAVRDVFGDCLKRMDNHFDTSTALLAGNRSRLRNSCAR